MIEPQVTGTVLALFDTQVAASPDRTAVRWDGGSTTYAQLRARSLAVAATLAEQGVGPGDTVGLLARRSTDLVVGILGVFRAGAACVPLDAGYPAQRLRYMCATADVRVWLGHAELLHRVGAPAPVAEIGALTVSRHDTGAVRIPAPAVLDPGSLAYIVYTSGSTGRPKGVMYEHRNLANLITWQIADSGCGHDTRTAQFSPASFDIVFQEVFSTLGAGGTLVCLTEGERLDPELLVDVIARERLNRLYMPFVAIQALARYAEELTPDRHPLREIITAGEQVQCGEHIRGLFHRLDRCRLVNQWGTTETHVTTSNTLPERVSDWPLLPSIGTAIRDSAVTVRDEHGRMLPDGEVGELWVTGSCVGRGYLGAAGRPGTGFLPDPLAPQVPAYRTGDLGRVGANGDLEFLGRMDSQVKVRGFRIELGEVEANLNALPDVLESVVVVMGDDPATRYLQAYVVPAGPQTRGRDVLAALRGTLPAYLVPSRVVLTGQLPRTLSGKVDRRAVAQLDTVGR
ncbi:amino acid adenylation domain-containing protein [Dactylosporangium sp. NPDC051485]|uniref:amino acid adenylation domain-containing protein n=1 Tax=Dactylosporangium sp. NPDC051485 TaxID=3154846 RepID=UPI00343C9923